MAVSATSSGSKSTIKIVANIFISFIGAGVLGLPFAFKEAGVIEGILVMSAVGLVSVKAMLLIIDCKYKLIKKHQLSPTHKKDPGGSDKKLIIDVTTERGTGEEKCDLLREQNGTVKEDPMIPEAPGQELSYGDVGFYAIGKSGRLLVDVAILVSQVGFCCAYLIFILENLSDYIKGVPLWGWLLILLPPLYLLTLLRHLSSLAISSLFAQCSNLMAFGVVFWFDLEHLYKVEVHPKSMSIYGLPFFLAVGIYCYEGAGMILSLESSMAKEIRHRFKWLFMSTMVIVTLLYISFGVFGYLSFGPETNAIITLNLPKGSSLDFAIMVKSCLCLSLFFTYPVMMFPVMRILERKLSMDPNKRWPGNVLRFLMVSLTGMIVMVIPNFANLMALIGASCCTLLAFILPGLFHMFIYRGTLTKWQWFVDVFLILMGVVGCAVCLTDTIKRMVHGDRSLV
ncbi:uncharacterized protein LOC135493268 isoform X2 [Lineus longissimus]|uniref:uncharacterized protein LOC135493268 isoform X2 n=1 Tax=Lineus longissimus TaxID=88925 RepID=UPI00315DE6B4